jgi:hypothetical protein
MHLLDNSGEITPKDRFFKYLADLSKALLLNLSVNYQKQAQNNAVVVQQKEMDRVGFEPTTSASIKVAPSHPISIGKDIVFFGTM